MLSQIKRCLWRGGLFALLAWGVGLAPIPLRAEEAAPAVAESVVVTDPAPGLSDRLAAIEQGLTDRKVVADTIWVLLTAFLVFWMNAGFALVESGMCRAKNAVNILSKNFIVFAVSSLAFYFVGWGIMFGDGNGFMGLKASSCSPECRQQSRHGLRLLRRLQRHQLDGRSSLREVLLPVGLRGHRGHHCVRLRGGTRQICKLHRLQRPPGGIAYPITGHWIWGGGWLAQKGFWDFAGSTAVHTVGGVAGLAGILVLGPRIGKYRPDGTPNAIPGHNMTSATLGV
jgi:Amt family ammonium transporter